ncbi:polymer-forming cytoskeletal protein [Altererythrobacter salegens]|uniref:Polymer-forming cytoskeletal protein n=1 Tax=Croceibacterium salegens TaxID=1737568 RepID=A0A6I4SYN8_9SPHN|nr:polymer-forming cytoskeletal protein [Croceibacterium salegens]MXO60538.1 polymer-forming cytoskeletal protein [Croceibacterium salegens]
MANGSSTFSVIGTDVVIKGDVSASADLHVDGRIEGDITCASLVQGDGSTIEGAIKADNARLAGTVKGTIEAKELVVLKTARIEGDVHYDALTIEQGAAVEGRFAHTERRVQPVAAPAQPQAKKDDGEEPRLTLAG